MIKPKNLRPIEVPRQYHAYYDFSCQKMIGRNNHIWATCPQCGKGHWQNAALVRCGMGPRHRNCVSAAGHHRRYQVQQDYFQHWSHPMAYILGLLATDGSIVPRRIQFITTDMILADTLRQELGPTLPIFQNKKAYYGIYIHSKSLVKDLIQLGITPNKTFSLQWPPVPDEFLPSFIRGVIDGDGSLYFSQDLFVVRIKMCARDFLAGLRERVGIVLGLDMDWYYYTLSSGNMAYMVNATSGRALEFCRWIYSAPGPYLPRKKDLYLQALKDNPKAVSPHTQ